MPRGVGDRDGTALRYSKQRKPRDVDRINDRLKVADAGIKGQIIDILVGHAVTAGIVANERVIFG